MNTQLQRSCARGLSGPGAQSALAHRLPPTLRIASALPSHTDPRRIDDRIDDFDFFSSPSVAQHYFKINSCFAGGYQLCGSLNAFFQNFVSVGRVMTRNNVKQYVEKNIQDFDAVSLYPSAMHLFEGFLMGNPLTNRHNRLRTTQT